MRDGFIPLVDTNVENMNKTARLIRAEFGVCLAEYREKEQIFQSECQMREHMLFCAREKTYDYERATLRTKLFTWEEKLQAIEASSLIQAVKEDLANKKIDPCQKNDMAEKHHTVDALIEQCRQKMAGLQLNCEPAIEEIFNQLVIARRELQGAHIVFKPENEKYEQKKQASAKLAAAQEEEKQHQQRLIEIEVCYRQLKNQIKLIKSVLQMYNESFADSENADLNALRAILIAKEDAVAQPIADDLPGRAQWLVILNKLVEGQENNLIFLLRSAIQQRKNADEQALNIQKQQLHEKIGVEINDIKPILLSVVRDPLYQKILKEREHVLHQACIECYEEEIKIARIETLYLTESNLDTLLYYVDSVQAFKDKKAHFEELKKELDVFRIRTDAERILLPLASAAAAAEVDPVSREGRVQAPHTLFWQPVLCLEEREHLHNVLELLSQDEKTDVLTKTNALFLSIAILFEGLKQTQQKGKRPCVLIQRAIEIRDAIFHCPSEMAVNEEKYRELCFFAQSFVLPQQSTQEWNEKIERFFEILPKGEKGVLETIIVIDQHIARLRRYMFEIENNVIRLEENLLIQLDIAFRVSQLGALIRDLKILSDNDELEKILRERRQDICQLLNMRPLDFNALGKVVRHQGPSVIKEAAEAFLVAIAEKQSEASLSEEIYERKVGEDEGNPVAWPAHTAMRYRSRH